MDAIPQFDERVELDPDTVGPWIAAWLQRLNRALESGNPATIGALFREDAHWRDIVALTWSIGTLSGVEDVASALAEAGLSGAGGFEIDPDRAAPRLASCAGEPVLEAIVRFRVKAGRGAGVVRIKQSDAGTEPVAWTLMTALDSLEGHDIETLREQREEPAFERDFCGPNWLDRRREAVRYADRDPAVLIVGGGHAGLTAAASLKALGVETLIVDRMRRVGDNWRLRYHGLKLHNQVHSNHMPFLPFPATWPNYIPKDKIANWLELYVEALELDFWTETTFAGATYDEQAGCWDARLTLPNGSTRTMRPRHVVMATSVSGTPNIPAIPTLDRFGGTVVHSSGFRAGAIWAGQDVFVVGTGTSAHDIAQDLHANGARVTMIQRGPTLVVNVEPGAQLYDEIYHGSGPSLADRDLLNSSYPMQVVKAAQTLTTQAVRVLDASLYRGLEQAGFRLDLPDNDPGWPWRYRQRGGGYYFNVGCSELIAEGEIGVVQAADIEEWEQSGLRLRDGGLRNGSLVVLATGYKGQDHLVGDLFGPAVAARVGPVWGFDDRTQELRNMWVRGRQPGLWFTGGSFAQCRIYSKYLALQIKADQVGASPHAA
jgi:cation diffusion facilitator CzcD-associated flavoprotein CzcO